MEGVVPMKTDRLRAVLSLLCSLAVIGLTAVSLAVFFLRSGEGNMAVRGVLAFRYFTVDSNILAAVAGIFVLREALVSLRGAQFVLPRRVQLIKFVGTGAVGLTFTVVMVFLGPLYGYKSMFRGMNLWLHLINPVLAMLSFLLLERGAPLKKRDLLWGLLPVVVYGLVYLVQVVVTKRWPDFYFFNRNGQWYLSFAAVLTGAALLDAALRLGHNAVNKKTSTYKERSK